MILVDNTVLSNFALVHELSLLKHFCGSRGATTIYVSDEFKKGIQSGLLDKPDFSWLTELDFDSESERKMFFILNQRLGSGESSCLVIAVHRKYDFLSDDMLARKYALKEGIRVSGSIGVLIGLIHKNFISLDKGNEILKKFIKRGYFSPIEMLDNYL